MLYRQIDIPRGTSDINAVIPPESEGVTTETIVGAPETVKARIASIGKASPMLAGALAFYPEDEFTNDDLRKLAVRFESYLLAGKVRGVDYDICWAIYSKGGSTELRFILPLSDRQKKPLQVPKRLLDGVALWVKVQNQTFGWKFQFTEVRAGVRPDFAYDRTKGQLKPYLVSYLEEAVMAGDLTSREDIIKDLATIQFDLMVDGKASDSLTVKYTGNNSEINKKKLLLEGVIFEQGFGRIIDPALSAEKLAVDKAVKDGLAVIEAAVNNARQNIERLQGDADTVFADAARHRIGDAVGEFEEDVRATIRTTGDDAKKSLLKFVDDAKKSLLKFVDGEVEGYAPQIAETSAGIKELQKRLGNYESRIEAAVAFADKIKKPFLIGCGLAAGLTAIALGVSLWSGSGNALTAQNMEAIAQRAEELDASVLDHLEHFNESADATIEQLDANKEALAVAQAGMRGLLLQINDVRSAFAIETKENGTEVLTVYVRRLPSIRDCERDPACVVRINPARR